MTLAAPPPLFAEFGRRARCGLFESAGGAEWIGRGGIWGDGDRSIGQRGRVFVVREGNFFRAEGIFLARIRFSSQREQNKFEAEQKQFELISIFLARIRFSSQQEQNKFEAEQNKFELISIFLAGIFFSLDSEKGFLSGFLEKPVLFSQHLPAPKLLRLNFRSHPAEWRAIARNAALDMNRTSPTALVQTDLFAPQPECSNLECVEFPLNGLIRSHDTYFYFFWHVPFRNSATLPTTGDMTPRTGPKENLNNGSH